MLCVNIHKSFPGMSIDLAFDFSRGILALFGPSGSGKTTILNCIAGLQQPDKGIVTLCDRVLFSSDSGVMIPVRKRRIGYVFQNYALFPHMTVKDNVMYGVPQHCKRGKGYRIGALDVMHMLMIDHLQNRYPEQISGGEKQRVALARALMVEPDMLLLDEPLSALDQACRRNLQVELKRLQGIWKIPFVLVTHSRQEMHNLADEVIFLEQGRKKAYVFPAMRSSGLSLAG
jgi:molybdate transport system ATP-binding protein